ncbi:hypothetical protein ACFQUU_01010 [Herbaspirillum sp. GCM10030257]|uniref:hypothetical protein n=1 Tax=Herbaspirillum sp. GCM10030257 TaxID=3273393 RepID=UPI003618EAFE
MTVTDYLTAILVFITAIYSYLTHKMAKASEASVQAMREQSEAMFRPYVTISPYVRPHTTVLYLRIENTGRSAAENLQLSMDRDFFQFGEVTRTDHNLRTKAAFVEPIQNLPPSEKLVFALAQGFLIFGSGADPNRLPQQFKITAQYRFGEKEFTEVNCIDLRPYIGSEGERDPVVEELERLRKVAEKWSNV